MQEAGFEEVEECVLRRHNTVTQYITLRPIMDLCEETVQLSGMWVVIRWWEKEVLDLLGAWEVTSASEVEDGAEETDGEAEVVVGK